MNDNQRIAICKKILTLYVDKTSLQEPWGQRKKAGSLGQLCAFAFDLWLMDKITDEEREVFCRWVHAMIGDCATVMCWLEMNHEDIHATFCANLIHAPESYAKAAKAYRRAWAQHLLAFLNTL